ncbi:MAG: hypothetical protein RLZZ618_1461 [Pseudomonadota bacterium]|jgi:D-alanyl-D-alanine carboxypeptidase
MTSPFITYAQELGIPLSVLTDKRLVEHEEARDLVLAEVGANGTSHLLVPAAATAWVDLRRSALDDGVHLYIASAFRSIERQAEIIRRKLASGLSMDTILSASAPPGCSEHHTGRAVDVGTDEPTLLRDSFAETPAFAWLSCHAGRFAFQLSFPPGNVQGYVHEPWHWCHQSLQASRGG